MSCADILRAQISKSVTHVIHNAWKVDFNHTLKSFEQLIAGTRKLVDACSTFSLPITLLYTSSVSAAMAWDSASGPVPERPLSDPRVAAPTGYGASKYVTEHVRTLCHLVVVLELTSHISATGPSFWPRLPDDICPDWSSLRCKSNWCMEHYRMGRHPD